MARAEPPGYPGDAWLRCGQAVARTVEEGSRLDPVHRRTADSARLCWLHAGGNTEGAKTEGRAELSGDLHRGAQICAADLRHDAERDDETPRRSIPVKLGLP